jgi:TPR repeat protein
MKTKHHFLLIALTLIALVQAAPAFAVGGVSRDQGYLSDVDKSAIESMQSLMGERPDAQYAIGKIYARGGLERDAKVWMQKSANAGYPQAKMWVAEQKMKSEFRANRGRMLTASRRSLSRE